MRNPQGSRQARSGAHGRAAGGTALVVGQIVAAHGIRGDVKVVPSTQFLERFTVGATLVCGARELTVAQCREQKGALIVRFEEIADRNVAESLQWSYLEAQSPGAPELESDEFLTSELIGLAAETEEGRALGVVEDVLALPAHDVLVVAGMMVPAVKEFVLCVDLKGRKIVMRLIPGMEA